MFSTNIVKVVKATSLRGAATLPLEQLGTVEVKQVVPEKVVFIKSRKQPGVVSRQEQLQAARTKAENFCVQILQESGTEMTMKQICEQFAIKVQKRSLSTIGHYLSSLLSRGCIEVNVQNVDLYNNRRKVNFYKAKQ
jgi:hypothetical protein